MSSAPVVTPFQQLADHLSSTSGPRSEEERLFQRVVDAVCNKWDNPQAVDIVVSLRQAENADDISRLLDSWRGSNQIWQRKGTPSWTRRLGEISATFLKYKAVGDGFSQMNQLVAAPIWGLLCSALAIFKGLLETDANLDIIEKELGACFFHTSSLFVGGHTLSKNLEAKISNFYEVVIEFSLHLAIIFRETAPKSWVGVFKQDLNEKLMAFARELKSAREAVDGAMHSDNHRNILDMQTALAFPPSTQASTNNVTTIRLVPSMVSSSFVGRRNELATLQTSLVVPIHGGIPTRLAVLGEGGVGKSQILLQHLNHVIRDPAQNDISLFFVFAQNHSSMLQSYSIIGELLGISNDFLSEAFPTKLVWKVKNWLQTSASWIMVFDNVTDSNDLQEFVPVVGNGHVVITTRIRSVAETWAKSEKIIHLNPMDEDEGSELVFKLKTDSTNTNSILEQTAAREIVKLAGGLPLAIEQIVKNANRRKIPLAEAVSNCQNRKTLLEQKNFDSNHESNSSIGSIVQFSMESIRNPHAEALFRLLVFLDVSSIPLFLLCEAKKRLKTYFENPSMFKLGSTGLATTTPTTPVQQRQSTRTKLKLWVNFSKKTNKTSQSTPVESTSDSALRDLWSHQLTCLQEVLDDPRLISSAVSLLDDAGLVRRTGNSKIWIHDVNAELARALMQMETLETYKLNAHLISTMVYLTFPIPDAFKSEQIFSLLPHAITTYKHLKDSGVLNDTIIGAELGHIIASSLLITQRPKKPEEFTQVIKYYTQAYTAYKKACDRLEKTGITQEEIVSAILEDYEQENNSVTAFPVNRYLLGYERLGTGPHWRMINTAAKLGTVLHDALLFEQALRSLTSAANWYEKVFGLDQWDTIVILEQVACVHSSMGNFEAAYETSIKRAKGYMYWNEEERSHLPTIVTTSAGLVNTIDGSKIARQLGSICLKIPGREKDAIKWFEIQLIGRQNIFGQTSAWCTESMQNVATAYKHYGDLEAYVYWCTRSVDAVLDEMEYGFWYVEEEEGWKKSWHTDDEILSTIRTFRESITDTSRLPADLEHHTMLVEMKVKRWEKWRDVREEQQKLKMSRLEEEEDAYDQALVEFNEIYPTSQMGCYQEMINLFESYRKHMANGGETPSFRELGAICAGELARRNRDRERKGHTSYQYE